MTTLLQPWVLLTFRKVFIMHARRSFENSFLLKWMVMLEVDWSLVEAMGSSGCVRRMIEMNGSRKQENRRRNMQKSRDINNGRAQPVGCPLERTWPHSSGPRHWLVKGKIEARPL